jgi:hypothetical protein
MLTELWILAASPMDLRYCQVYALIDPVQAPWLGRKTAHKPTYQSESALGECIC